MAKVNTKAKAPKKATKKVAVKKPTATKPKIAPPIYTAQGGAAQRINPKLNLQRSLMTTLLWEDAFYDSGKNIAKRLADLVPTVNPKDVVELARMAKNDMKLRHAPLFILRELARYTEGNLAKTKFPYQWTDVNVGSLVAEGLVDLVKRPDELAEFLSMYWKDKKQPIAASIKRGLAEAFSKFDEYQLAKWNRDNTIKLRDVLFLTHAKPKTNEQEELFRKLVDKTLETPDTWEVALSSGADKKETWERLIRENRIGGMALLKNLRNMTAAGVDEKLIRERLERGVGIALPFNFVTAAKYAPTLTKSIEKAMFKALDGMPKLTGRTLLVVDTSGSMGGRLASKSEVSRMDAAGALALMARHLCDSSVVYVTAGDDYRKKHATALVPEHVDGFSLMEKIRNANHEYGIGGGGIFMVQCLEHIQNQKHGDFDRVIVFTDEQDCDTPSKNPALAARLGKFNYVVNVGNEKNGISYKNQWDHIDGWSEKIFDYIRLFELDAENLRPTA